MSDSFIRKTEEARDKYRMKARELDRKLREFCRERKQKLYEDRQNARERVSVANRKDYGLQCAEIRRLKMRLFDEMSLNGKSVEEMERILGISIRRMKSIRKRVDREEHRLRWQRMTQEEKDLELKRMDLEWEKSVQNRKID